LYARSDSEVICRKDSKEGILKGPASRLQVSTYASHTFPSISTSDRDELKNLVTNFPPQETFLKKVAKELGDLLTPSKSLQGPSTVGSDSDEDNEEKLTSESTKTSNKNGPTSGGGGSKKRPATVDYVLWKSTSSGRFVKKEG
ncbi:hypothetical protein TrCOL_g9487, partial [Triparma columacea]